MIAIERAQSTNRNSAGIFATAREFGTSLCQLSHTLHRSFWNVDARDDPLIHPVVDTMVHGGYVYKIPCSSKEV